MAEVLVRSVGKALDSLDFVVRSSLTGEGATLSDIAAELDEKLPTVRNILKTMEQCGYLSRSGKFYVPGSKCGDLRRGVVGRRLIAALEPLLRRAAAETGESFVLTTLLDGRREVLLRVQGGSEVVVNLKATDSHSPYSLITGRVMLALADEPERRRFLEANGEPGECWPEAAGGKLAEALAALRAEPVGFMAAPGKLAGYAIGLVDRSGMLLGAVGAYAPAFRTDEKHDRLLRETLGAIAEAAKDF